MPMPSRRFNTVISMLIAVIMVTSPRLQSQQSKNAARKGNEASSAAPPCPVEDTPREWKTYVNRQYRFCLSYPPVYKPVAEPWSKKYAESPTESRQTHQIVKQGRYFLLEDTQQPGALVSVVVTEEPFDLQSLARTAPTGTEGPPEPREFNKQVFYYYGAGGGGVDYDHRYFYDLRGKTLIVAFGPATDSGGRPSVKTEEMEPQILWTFRTY